MKLEARKVLDMVNTPEHEAELRIKSLPVDFKEYSLKDIQKFADDMKTKMLEVKMPKGWKPVGLSAIQVGVPLRMFWAMEMNSDNYELFINPTFQIIDFTQSTDKEGCLSIPKAEGLVKRFNGIKVKYTNYEGEQISKKLYDWNARIVMHEIDHLEGILFTDKLIEDEKSS